MNNNKKKKPEFGDAATSEREPMPITCHPVWLDPDETSLRINPSGMLEGNIGGRETVDLSARAAFPFTMPDAFIELRTHEKEYIGFIRDVNQLSPQSREAVRKAVADQHFVPLIKRIRSIKGSHHCYTWKVSTDRGDAGFTTAGRRQNVEEIGGDEYIVTDSTGNRFRIPSTPNLDARSLAQLRKIL